MPKGIELPINILVVIAIAVIVLLAMVALFMGGFKPAGAVSAEAAWSDSCRQVIYKCSSIDQDALENIKLTYDVKQDGSDTNDNLWSLCTEELYKGTDAVSCRRACGCTY